MVRNYLSFQNYVNLAFYLRKCDLKTLEWSWVTSFRRDFLHRRVPMHAIYIWNLATLTNCGGVTAEYLDLHVSTIYMWQCGTGGNTQNYRSRNTGSRIFVTVNNVLES